MASTNKTVNLALSQYVDTDTPTYLGDYNADMLAIDNGYGELKAKSADVESRMLTIESDTKTLQTDVKALQSNQATTSTQVSELTEKVTANTTSITAINTGAQATVNKSTIAYGDGHITTVVKQIPLVGITLVDISVSSVTISNGAQVELYALPSGNWPDHFCNQLIDRDAGTGVTLRALASDASGKVWLQADSGTEGSVGTFATDSCTLIIQNNR